MLEITLFLMFFHALELLTESAIDVIEISGNVGKLCIAVLFVKNHPQVKTQVAVTPMVCDVYAKVFCVFQPSQGVFNRLNVRGRAALNIGQMPYGGSSLNSQFFT